jgi:ERCC4-related helicase/ERCC4-type nuclease
MASYIEHPLLKENAVEKRPFQLELAVSALGRSSLVVLPTGLGKTIVALLVLLARLNKGKILLLAPTRPLVEQHAAFLKNVLADESLVTHFTGETPPEKRSLIWQQASIIVSTPQVVENDLLSKRIELEHVSCIIFDEAHRATGNYAYVYIASRYSKEAEDPLVLGITASPGSNIAKIDEVCSNLGIENIEIMTDDDPGIEPFIHKKKIEWVSVTVPAEIVHLRNIIENVLADRMDELSRLLPDQLLGYGRLDQKTSKRELLDLQKSLRSSLARQPNRALYSAVSVLAEVFKLKHAVELAETQGTDALAKYLGRLENEARSKGGSKASRRIMEDPGILKAISLLARLDMEHPKLVAVRRLVEDQLRSKDDSLIIVFTNYRDTARTLVEFLSQYGDYIRPVRFVGQSSRPEDQGLSQKKQAEILSKFRKGDYNVLVATSVGEEGIDIPATDMVLFYEPVPSEIRSIQRKGRTGRTRAGRVVVLIAKGTRDEAYYWISNRKEKSMQRQIRDMGAISGAKDASKDELAISKQIHNVDLGEYGISARQISNAESSRDETSHSKQISLAGHTDDEFSLQIPNSAKEQTLIGIYVDSRERDVAKKVEALGIDIKLKTLEVGDYVVSDRVGIERKTAEDFVDSIVHPEREFFRQISDLSRSYERPILILEGSEFYNRQMHPNALRGALASIAVDFGVSIIPTENVDGTAALIALIARREQGDGGRVLKDHGSKTSRTLKEQQEYLISAIPSVGPAVARNLLKHFRSVENIVNASRDELMAVELVGPKIAERIRELVSGEYKG